MADPSAIEVTRTVEYRLGVDYQLNERPGKLFPLCGSTGSYSDKKAQIEDQFDDLVAQEKTERNGDTKNTDLSAVRRWIAKPRTQNVSPLIDRDDAISTKLDLNSPAAKQTAKAIRRAQDVRMLQGYFGNAITGEEGTTIVPFKAANILPANADEAADSGVTLNKLIAMLAMIEGALVDTEEEMPVFVYTSKQKKDLLKIAQFQSRDFNPMAVQALQNGKVTDFMGFRFVPAEIGNAAAYPGASALTVAAGTGYRLLPVFVPSGLHRGVWTDFFGKVSDRNDKNHSMQIYGETCVGVSRVNEDKCFLFTAKEV